MDERSIGLIIFAFTALAAVFAFILVLGGPEPSTTGQAGAKIGTSTFKYRDSYQACSVAHCSDGLPGMPTGNYDEIRELYECRCQTSDPTFLFYRSAYAPG